MNWFSTILEMSISGGILIVMVIVIRAVFLNQFPKKVFNILWLVVLCRLLIPVFIPMLFHSPVSQLAGSLTPSDSIISFSGQTSAAPAIADSATGLTGEPAFEPAFTLSWDTVWLAGAAIGAVLTAVLYIRSYRRFRFSWLCENKYVLEWAQSLPLRRRVRVRISDRVGAPLTYGIIRPVILLPSTMDIEDRAQLSYILEHELTHIRRLDSLTKILLAAGVCVHWFNPFVWAMYYLANQDIEISCDERVLRSVGAGSKSAYARALVQLEECKLNRLYRIPFANSFSQKATQERVVAIMRTKKKSAVAVAFAVCILLFSATAFAAAYNIDIQSEQPYLMATYGVDKVDGSAKISMDGGDTWHANGYKDSHTGVIIRYDAQTGGSYVSPDNGVSWYDQYYTYASEEDPQDGLICHDSTAKRTMESTDGGKTWADATERYLWLGPQDLQAIIDDGLPASFTGGTRLSTEDCREALGQYERGEITNFCIEQGSGSTITFITAA